MWRVTLHCNVIGSDWQHAKCRNRGRIFSHRPGRCHVSSDKILHARISRSSLTDVQTCGRHPLCRNVRPVQQVCMAWHYHQLRQAKGWAQSSASNVPAIRIVLRHQAHELVRADQCAMPASRRRPIVDRAAKVDANGSPKQPTVVSKSSKSSTSPRVMEVRVGCGQGYGIWPI
jgi:hypothetical protein